MNPLIVRLSLGASLLVLMAVVTIQTVEAEDKAEQILKASHDYVAARSVEIQQTVEQTARVLVDGKQVGAAQTTKQTSRIEIDADKGLIRMTVKDQNGKDLVVLRKGDRIAMKIGSDPWTAPKGPYAQIGNQLANPFACPLPKAGLKHSPKWTIVGDEQIDGQEMIVIKTAGDSANAYSQERMRDGIALVFPDAAARPTIEVLTYESRHWIGKADDRRQRVEQTSHHQMTMPGGAKAVVDVVGKTTAVYRRYNKIDIDAPEEACRILNSEAK